MHIKGKDARKIFKRFKRYIMKTENQSCYIYHRQSSLQDQKHYERQTEILWHNNQYK